MFLHPGVKCVVERLLDTLDMVYSVRQSCIGPLEFRVDVATREPLHRIEEHVARMMVEDYRVIGTRVTVTFGHVKGAVR